MTRNRPATRRDVADKERRDPMASARVARAAGGMVLVSGVGEGVTILFDALLVPFMEF